IELGMAGQMHLAILADDFSVPVDQDRGIEMMAIGGELGINERQPDAIVSGLLEQRTRRRARHLAVEPSVYFRLLRPVPARGKGVKGDSGEKPGGALLGFGPRARRPRRGPPPPGRLPPLGTGPIGPPPPQTPRLTDPSAPPRGDPPLQPADQAHDRPQHNKVD